MLPENPIGNHNVSHFCPGVPKPHGEHLQALGVRRRPQPRLHHEQPLAGPAGRGGSAQEAGGDRAGAAPKTDQRRSQRQGPQSQRVGGRGRCGLVHGHAHGLRHHGIAAELKTSRLNFGM